MTEASDRKDFRLAVFALAAPLVLGALLPILLTDGLPHDMAENLYWGR